MCTEHVSIQRKCISLVVRLSSYCVVARAALEASDLDWLSAAQLGELLQAAPTDVGEGDLQLFLKVNNLTRCYESRICGWER